MTAPSKRFAPMAPPTANGHRPAAGAGGLGAPRGVRKHPPGYIALAVALIVGLGALSAYLYTQAGQKVTVVMAVQDIAAGHVIERADLSTVEVSPTVLAVGGENLNSVVGQIATVEILPKTLVQRAMLTTSSPLSSSQAIVGVAAVPGQTPSSGFRPGDKVEVLALPQKGATAATGTGSTGATGATAGAAPGASVLADSAVVYDVRANPAAAGGVLLSLIVPKDASAGIATASNNGLIALVKVGG